MGEGTKAGTVWALCAGFTPGLRAWWCQHCQLLPPLGCRGRLGVNSALCCPKNSREELGTFCFIWDCHENLRREAAAKEAILGIADCVGSSSSGQGGNCADSAAPNTAKELLLLPEFLC